MLRIVLFFLGFVICLLLSYYYFLFSPFIFDNFFPVYLFFFFATSGVE